MFKLMYDKDGKPFFGFVTSESNIRNISELGPNDINSFLRPILPVTKRATGMFTSALSTRDDVLLAFLSLLLLLAIEGLVATLLLRSRNGHTSNFGFSVKQTVELLRDFNVRQVYSKRGKRQLATQRINKKLVIIAVSILLFTFGLETSILFLTSTGLADVTNDTATFRIMQPVTPKWDKVYHHFRASWNRPCRSGRLDHVDQAQTRINVCITTTRDGEPPQLFELANDTVKAVITSYLHRYGADHELTINNENASYWTRAYFSLDDKKLRVMAVDARPSNEAQLVEVIHNLLISYLCTAYWKETKDERMTEERLNQMERDFDERPSREMNVLRDRSYKVEAAVYMTTIEGVLPRGSPAFHVAQNVFGGAAALTISKPDKKDLFVDETRVESVEGVVWREPVRLLNWLSLCLILILCVLTLSILRCWLRPVSSAEIAGIFVKGEVGAVLSRSPVELADNERRYFHVGSSEGSDFEEGRYVFGAETDDQVWKTNREYDRVERDEEEREVSLPSSETRISLPSHTELSY